MRRSNRSSVKDTAPGGVTWKRLEGHGLPHSPVGRIAVRVAKKDSNRVYAEIETGDGVPSCKPCRYGRHLELDVCAQESYQGWNVSALECVNVSVKDVLELGFDRIEEFVFWPVVEFIDSKAWHKTLTGVDAPDVMALFDVDEDCEGGG